MAYVEASDLTAYLRSTIVADEAEFDAARLSGEQAINSYCQRVFDVPTVATTRTFVPDDYCVLRVPDIANTTGLVIVDNGATLSASDYQLEVSPGMTNTTTMSGRSVPYTVIRRMSGTWYMDPNGNDTLSITAQWGWAATPPEVPLANKLIARDFLLARDTSFGIVQVGDFSRLIAANNVVESLLFDLRRPEAYV
jgi:hypothetical protein